MMMFSIAISSNVDIVFIFQELCYDFVFYWYPCSIIQQYDWYVV